MYKRAARVVYVCEHNNGYSLLATAWADKNAREWIEPRAAGFEPAPVGVTLSQLAAETGLDLGAEQQYLLNDELLAWADLVVTLDEASTARCPKMPTGTRHKAWQLPELNTDASETELKDRIETICDKVQCMVGGMKMLSRLQEDDTDDE